MAETRYADLHLSPPSLRVQTVGTVQGPPLGDGWSLVTNLPAEKMPAGAGEYAVVVSGKIGDLLVSGSAPSSGVMQLCLGTTQNLRLPHMRVSQSLTIPMGAQEGVPFQFLLVVSAADPDPVLGASFAPAAGSNELVLWGRTYLNGDPQTYYAEFTVADVSWLWFDLARIPSSDVHFTEEAVGAILTKERFKLRGLSPVIGATDETWLHFGNVWYEPRQHLAKAPRFRMGLVPEGAAPISPSCTVSLVGGAGGARARFTASPGTFLDPFWRVGSGVSVSGSALGTQGAGGNNSPFEIAQRVFARSGDGSWIELEGVGAGAFVVEGPRVFTLEPWHVETMLGNSTWGVNRKPATSLLPEVPQVQQGAFWAWTNTSSVTQVGYDAWEDATTTAGAIMRRWRHLAVRIDQLPDVRHDTRMGPNAGGVRLIDNWEGTFLTVERPAPDPGVLVEPIVMVHQVAKVAGQVGAYGSRVTEIGGTFDGEAITETLLPLADAAKGEAVSSIALGRRIFQTLSPSMQWRAHLVGSDSSPPTVQQVFDFQFVAFHPVREPRNVSTPPGPPLAPIILSPGKQGPSPESLPVPPTEPNANPPEAGENVRPQIRGATGYRRSWPIGSKPLRRLTVTWGPLPESEAGAMFEFLRDNPTWRYTPPRSAAQSAMNTSSPVMTPASHRSFTVSVDVVILVWTGA